LFQSERWIRFKLVHQLSQQVRLVMDRWRVDRGYSIMEWMLTTGFSWALLVYGIALVMKGSMTLGSLIALRLYLSNLSRPLEGVSDLVRSTVLATVSVDRLQASVYKKRGSVIMPATMRVQTTVPVAPRSGELRNIDFGYDGQPSIFRGLSLQIEPGSVIGLTGPSGSGKSTLISMLTRFVEPLSGQILIDGVDCAKMPVGWVRSQISVVPQEVFLFAATVAENIGLGNREAPFTDIVAAARAADAEEFILALPNGYDTMLGEQGQILSHGQMQRITIARSLLKQSGILILDEALNSLDVASRTRVVASLRAANSQRTIVIVSHAIEMLRECDSVAVLDNGLILQTDQRKHHYQETGFLRLLFGQAASLERSY